MVSIHSVEITVPVQGLLTHGRSLGLGPCFNAEVGTAGRGSCGAQPVPPLTLGDLCAPAEVPAV